MGRPLRVLYVCTGNSCRSQMAEGFTRYSGGGEIEARSAGIEAHGIDPMAIAVMEESGIDISGQESSILSGEMLEWADLVITLCSDADSNCPALPPGTDKIHRPFTDPRKAEGTEEEIAVVYRSVRDDIRLFVAELLDHHLQ